MKPRRKPLVCVAVLDARERRSASSAFQRRFHMEATEATQASKKKKPAHVGKRQNRAGHDDQILTGKPLVIRWFVYVFAALFMCGIIPMAIAGGLITFCETYHCEWLIFVLCGAVIWLIFRIIERDI